MKHLLAIFLFIAAASPAYAECATGYTQVTVPLCQKSAGGPVIGDANIESRNGDSSNFDTILGPSTISASQLISDASIFLYSPPTIGSVIQLGIYDSSGVGTYKAGHLLASTAFFAPAAANQWTTAPLTAPVTLQPGTYYIGFISLNNSLQLGVNRSGTGTECWAGTYNSLQNPFPQSSPAGNGCQASTYSICVGCSAVIQNPQPAPVTNCAGPTTQAGSGQMAVLAPCSPTVVTANQPVAPALIDIGISDANATVAAGSLPISVQAIGMSSVAVWTHGVSQVTLTDSGGGHFTGNLNLSSEPAGPLHVMFIATAPASGSPTIQLKGEYTLFVAGSRPAIPTPAPASGLTLAFSDHFTSLNALPCHPATGTWPSCAQPTASDAKWYENLFNGQDFGDCANEHTDGAHNPFTILPQGGLRIRNQYDPSYVDPYGFGRTQYCGVLSTGFPGGSNSLTVAGNGYFDARVLVPNGACGAAGNNSCSGGSWPSFWMLSMNNPSGGIELDEMEEYGNDTQYFQGFLHAYSPATIAGGGGYAGYPDGDLTWDWHTVGMLITGYGTSGARVCNYFDEVQLQCNPAPMFGDGSSNVSPTWSLMVELASGGGWAENPPPSNQYDLFVDWIAVWH